MTPTRSDDATRYRLTLRDFIVAAVAIAGMWGVQVATQGRTQASIENLATKMDGYVSQQNATNAAVQQQIAEWRSETKLNRERSVEQDKALSELRGFLVGSGIIKGNGK